jgi:hypothetical protein
MAASTQVPEFPLPENYFEGGKFLSTGELQVILERLHARVYNNATRPAASTFSDGTTIVNVDDKDFNIAIGGKWYRNGIET